VNSQQIGSYCERYSPDFIIIAKLYAIWVCGLDTNKLAQKIIFALYWPKQLLEVWAFGKKLAQKKIKKGLIWPKKGPTSIAYLSSLLGVYNRLRLFGHNRNRNRSTWLFPFQ
jgi:hypothetical protein